MKVVNGTSYHDDTPGEVIRILENARIVRSRRLVLEYGDREAGCSWGDREIGYIGRSTGTVKIPITVFNRRAMGGPGILTHCIVRILTAQGKHVLYQHPNYRGAQDGTFVACAPPQCVID